jgi:nicotinamidase-related amidase/8-oxo-dGTP pyrophosphatase MutT (NUDIX family)
LIEDSMNALILVDLQNDFLPGGALAVPHGDDVLPVANALQPFFELIVATQDWHPRDHQSFASQHAGRSVGDSIQLEGLPQILWPDHCVQGTRGAELASALQQHSIAAVFRKGVDPTIDSYSGFFDNGHRRSTGLGDYLKEQRVSEVFVLGLATDYCVRATALDALELGFRTFLIEDACRGVDLQPGDVRKAVEEMERRGVERVTSDRWLDADQRQRMRAARQCILAEGIHLRMIESRGWEFAERRNVQGVVIIVPITDQQELVIIEQYREPLGRRSIELPAGLVGDVPGEEEESLETAVRRELREETGFEASQVRYLGDSAPSAGMSAEEISVFVATGLRRVDEGGGDESEQILVHCVPLSDVPDWLAQRSRDGYCVAMSVYGALWLAQQSAAPLQNT